MIYSIPIVGWLIGFFLHVSLAVPFYFLWGAMAPKYFYFVPKIYMSLPFWDCVWLFMLLSILKSVLLPHWGSSSSSSAKE